MMYRAVFESMKNWFYANFGWIGFFVHQHNRVRASMILLWAYSVFICTSVYHMLFVWKKLFRKIC